MRVKKSSDQSIKVNERHNPDGTISQAEFEVKMAFYQKRSKTPKDILLYKGYDPDEWEISQVTTNEWTTTTADIQKWNQQLKFVVKPKTNTSIKDLATKLLQSVEPAFVKPTIKGKRNLVIPLADLHFPILSERKFETYLSDVLAIINKGYKTIIIEVLGDIFHSNAMKASQTIKGTQLEDVDMVEAIELAKTFFITLIDESLRKSSEVRIEFASGNHSDFEYLFLMYLETLYPQVSVNKHNLPRIAYQLDNVGIMLTHGHFGKKGDYPMLFATEFRDVWSKSSWLEIHQGHYHSMEAQNLKGVIHRQLGTIKPNDQYESENGYTMNYKSTQAFEYSADKLKVIYELG
ncbi:helix-turn-helix domain-containing protein [Enterococcus gallinarum]|uniref:helix-turn-helix domain-containing protein n=1 Tax=Enterococcus gallinarum TaxID=1353 RepID=UPI00288E3100|nr:helix-turn-helix domain-containing protein [Enterococcus gallinarum]MDT2720614.1 helix-turn-helix domain-containing protein [Enterococcus gallinarum]